jgi:hypothetical protein
MKKNTTKTISAKSARHAKFHALTETEIKRAVAKDRDADTPREAAVWGRGEIVCADGRVLVPIEVDARTARFFSEHHLDYQSFLAGVLKAFAASREKGA